MSRRWRKHFDGIPVHIVRYKNASVAPFLSEVRARSGLSQRDFAKLLGVSPRTLQDWEQGRREPTGAAGTLLKVAALHPELLRDIPLAGP